ncbi:MULTISPECIES: hypothetical protein [unclassified Microbacterium]|uniref:hypothetical protein n=1 Tax=unclassified Microbacterium TaxID=2609290 RepID=UPI0030104744
MAEVTAQAKLPDDLAFDEYAQIIGDLQLALSFAAYLDAADHTWDDRTLADSVVTRVQYGSDFVVVMGIAATALGGLYTVSKILKNLADAAHVNEQRLGLREERRRKNREEKPTDIDDAYSALNSGLRGSGKNLDGMTFGQMTKLLHAIRRLSDYRVTVTIVTLTQGNPDADAGP